MTDDRLLERTAREWLEAGPAHAPDRPVLAALARIQTISQERDLRIPWRPRTMLDRLAVAVAVAVLAIGTMTLVASMLVKPGDFAAGACPPTQFDATAVDTFPTGLTSTHRAWGIDGGAPVRVRAGRVAAFDHDATVNVTRVVAIDPSTGDRCVLVQLAEVPPIQGPGITSLDWSPAGDALAIGLGGPEGPAGQLDGQLLIWTWDRLLRIWAGPNTPYVAWAPDGRSIAVWDGVPNNGPAETRLVFADGSPDRVFAIAPWLNGLAWSPDGASWTVAQLADPNPTRPQTVLATVALADGRVTPLDGLRGQTWFEPVRYLDAERLLVLERQRDGRRAYLSVPLAAPAQFSFVPMPENALAGDAGSAAVFSPDGRRAAYVTSLDGGDVFIADLATPEEPIQVEVGMKVGSVGLAWSPDSSQLLMLGSRSGPSDEPVVHAVWVVNADGTDPREIATGNIVPLDDPWQPVRIP